MTTLEQLEAEYKKAREAADWDQCSAICSAMAHLFRQLSLEDIQTTQEIAYAK